MKMIYTQRNHRWILLQTKDGQLLGAAGSKGETWVYPTRRQARRIAKLAEEAWPECKFRPLKVSVMFTEL